MQSFVDITYRDMPEDAAVTTTIHHSVARLAAAPLELQRARVTVQPIGRRRVRVSVSVLLENGGMCDAASEHADAHVGVIDAFGRVRRASAHMPVVARALAA